jgi:membrane protease YdiL (CAAX protease family)
MLKPAIIAASLAASAGIWLWVIARRLSRRPLIPLARRKAVPWLGQDVLFIFLLAYLIALAASAIAGKMAGGEAARQATEQKLQTAHPAEQLLREGDWRPIALATFVAVVIAPLYEEFMFRVLLQGWLEAVWSRRRRFRPHLRRPPWSWMPVLLPALLFAAIHVRFGREPPSPRLLTAMFLGQAVACLATLGVALVVLRLGAGADAADLGWQPRKLATDSKLAIVALVAVAPPLLLLQGWLLSAVERRALTVAPDPVPLFFLALTFGYFYQRTHRVAPSWLLHAAFNATSIALFFVT